MVCLADHSSCAVEEPDNTSSGSDGTFSVLPHKRKPKLRSLADILVEKRNQTSSIRRTRSALSGGVQIASTKMEALLVTQLQVDIPAGVAEAAQCPGRKRKIILEEDREPLAATFPRAFAKRTKGPMLDVEKNCRRVEITDTVTKVVDSMRLDFPRTQQVQPKKVKAIDAQKMRHIRREDERAQMGEPNNVSSANLQEQVVPVETNLGGAPSMAKTVEVGTDGARKSIFGNCNIGGTMAFGLSVNSSMDAVGSHDDHSVREHRFIPDLNMEFPEKDAMEEEQQSAILYEERRLPLQKNLVPKKMKFHIHCLEIPVFINHQWC